MQSLGGDDSGRGEKEPASQGPRGGAEGGPPGVVQSGGTSVTGAPPSPQHQKPGGAGGGWTMSIYQALWGIPMQESARTMILRELRMLMAS